MPIPEETNDQRTESQEHNTGSGDRKKEGKNKDLRKTSGTHYDNIVHPNDERSEDPKAQMLLKKKQAQKERR